MGGLRPTVPGLLALGLVLCAGPASAILVTHVFEATPFVSGRLTYDTEAPSGLHLPPYDPRVGFDVRVSDFLGPGDLLLESNDAFGLPVEVTDEPDGDGLHVFSSAGPFSAFAWRIGLGDPSGTAFSSDALPTELSLEAFDSAWFTLSYYLPGWREDIVFPIDSLRTVPEPATVTLVVAGLLILAGQARGRRRS